MKSKNLAVLSMLYDNAMQRVHLMLQAGKMYNDPSLRDHVVWLDQLGKTIMTVYQIEKVRAQGDELIPPEKPAPDPIEKPRHSNPQNPNIGLGGIPSTGGWLP